MLAHPSPRRTDEALIVRKSAGEIETMRRAGRMLAQVFEAVESRIGPGASGIELDTLAERAIGEFGARPAFKGYRGYPATICFSVNEMIVHGIPGERRLQEGDIVSIDIGLQHEGYFVDAARTYPVGEIGPEAGRLLQATRRALEVGIEQCVGGNHLGDVSAAIQRVAEETGYSVVRELVGHGIGKEMHEKPEVPNFGLPGRGAALKEGMVLALEPMVNQGGPGIKVLDDNWGVVTVDGTLSAHFEHTVAVTGSGPAILTQMALAG